jgi:hypothetical protein
MDFDYVIIGSSPVELTLAYYLVKNNKKTLLVNNNDIIGGSYSTIYKYGLYLDNGPKLYSDSFVNFRRILKELNIDFYSLFRKTDNQLSLFNINENLIFFNELIKLFFNNYDSKNINCLEFMKKCKINEQNIIDFNIQSLSYYGKELVDITLYDFIEILNKQLMYHYYQPKISIDKLFFNKLIDFMEKTNNFKYIISDNYNILNNTIYIYTKIFSFNTLVNIETNKKISISLCLHYDKKLDLSSKNKLIDNKLQLNYNVLTDNTYLYNEKSVTVITANIPEINKDPEEIKGLLLEKLKEIFYNLPNPDFLLLNRGYYDNNLENSIIDGINLFNKYEPSLKVPVIDSDNFIEFIKFIFLLNFILFIFRI